MKRRLEDLYVRGRDLTIGDGGGDPVLVWIQKMNPLEHEKSIRKAGAAKARVLMAARDKDSEEWQEAFSDVADIGDRTALIDYLISDDVAKFQDAKEAELSFADEWAKDGYLQGLRDSWDDPDNPLSKAYHLDSENEEARRVFLELKRFTDQVQEEVQPEIERLRRDYEQTDEETLHDRALRRFVELRSGLAWLREYRNCEVYFSVREPDDHRKYYFTAREQVDGLAPQVFAQISMAYQELVVDVTEGKDSPRTPSSSPSSEPLDAAAI